MSVYFHNNVILDVELIPWWLSIELGCLHYLIFFKGFYPLASNDQLLKIFFLKKKISWTHQASRLIALVHKKFYIGIYIKNWFPTPTWCSCRQSPPLLIPLKLFHAWTIFFIIKFSSGASLFILPESWTSLLTFLCKSFIGRYENKAFFQRPIVFTS